MTNMKCSNTAMLLGYFKKKSTKNSQPAMELITQSQTGNDLRQIVMEKTDQNVQFLATNIRPNHNKLITNQKLREQAS